MKGETVIAHAQLNGSPEFRYACRHWSLLDLLRRFNNLELLATVAMIQSLRLQYQVTRSSIGANRPMDETNRKTVLGVVEKACGLLENVHFREAATQARFALQRLQ